MEIPATIQDMASAFAAFERAHWNSLPDPVKAVIEANRGGSYVDLFSKAAESLWANRADFTNNVSRTLTGQLAGFCETFGGWQDWRGGRGLAVVAAMSRDNGEDPPAGGWPDPESDPPANPAYLPEPPAPAEPQPPEA